MSDPFEALRNLDGGSTAAPPPAEEVRRRGDRLRRRRIAARTLGAACAVAVIGTGGVALGSPWVGPSAPSGPATQVTQTVDDEPTSSPSPTPSRKPSRKPSPESSPEAAPKPGPEPADVVDIPRGFPLTLNYPSPDADSTLTGPGRNVPVQDIEACGRSLYPVLDPRDRLGATFEAPEDYRGRQLTTYTDEATAGEALDRLVDGYRDCAREVFGDASEYVAFTEVRETGLGDEGFAAVRTYEMDGHAETGLTQVQVIRVGKAVLVSLTSGEGGAMQNAVDWHVDRETKALDPVVGAMCVFSGAGCG